MINLIEQVLVRQVKGVHLHPEALLGGGGVKGGIGRRRGKKNEIEMGGEG